MQSGHQQFNNYWLFTLALFWPLKKENAQGNEKKESIEVVLEKYLVEADQLFDNGQYNECYEVLKTLRVSNMQFNLFIRKRNIILFFCKL